MKFSNKKTSDQTMFKAALLTASIMLLTVGLACAEALLPVIVFDSTESPAQSTSDFKTVYSGPVFFSHGKHVSEYKLACGKCHHDDSGEPLDQSVLADGADSCSDCHSEPELLRGKALSEKSSEDILEHYPNVMHQSCIGCHKKHNNETHSLSAPEACRGCHAPVGE